MTLAAIVLGLIIGSFLNVVIARLPQHVSLWAPRSRCPSCREPIAARDNIPLLSFAILYGHCRACGARISWQYPIVEAVTGAMFGAAYWRFGATAQFAVAVVMLSGLVAITAIDLEHQIIPDAITLPGIVAGLVAAVVTRNVHWIDSLIGIAICGGVFVAIILASGGGMGGGDMKLGAMLGAFLGWKTGLFALFVAVIAGGIVAAVLLVAGRKSRKDAIPFGPFLALGGAVALLVGVPAFFFTH